MIGQKINQKFFVWLFDLPVVTVTGSAFVNLILLSNKTTIRLKIE